MEVRGIFKWETLLRSLDDADIAGLENTCRNDMERGKIARKEKEAAIEALYKACYDIGTAQAAGRGLKKVKAEQLRRTRQ